VMLGLLARGIRERPKFPHSVPTFCAHYKVGARPQQALSTEREKKNRKVGRSEEFWGFSGGRCTACRPAI
jgi:hypothetical protein